MGYIEISERKKEATIISIPLFFFFDFPFFSLILCIALYSSLSTPFFSWQKNNKMLNDTKFNEWMNEEKDVDGNLIQSNKLPKSPVSFSNNRETRFSFIQVELHQHYCKRNFWPWLKKKEKIREKRQQSFIIMHPSLVPTLSNYSRVLWLSFLLPTGKRRLWPLKSMIALHYSR